MGKTLYVSDLDGTLLRSDQTLSPYTRETINHLISNGMCFSFATARSIHTARKVTEGLSVHLPVVVYNGALAVDYRSGKPYWSNSFGSDGKVLLLDLLSNGIYPLVYSFLEGREKFSFLPSHCSDGMEEFLRTRPNDPRRHPVQTVEELFLGDLFYLTCIDEKEHLEPFYQKYRDVYHCVFDVDLYSGRQWLELMPKEASKSRAVCQLKKWLGCDRLVVFGDGLNDLDLFEHADACYAVGNAADPLKEMATGVLETNDQDAVAHFLLSQMPYL